MNTSPRGVRVPGKPPSTRARVCEREELLTWTPLGVIPSSSANFFLSIAFGFVSCVYTLSNTLNYLTPSTGKFTKIPQPDGGITGTPVSIPPLADIAMHWVSQDNSIWFTELAGNRIGRYSLS